LIATTPFVMVVHLSLPVQSVPNLVKRETAKPEPALKPRME
jgi:hypothetical protein